MLYEILKSIHNFFAIPTYAINKTFVINDGAIALPFIAGQYFIIEGSMLNDYKVFKYGTDTLIDETFTGTITPLNIPSEFIVLATEIENWVEKNKDKKSLYMSESFGGYSYSKGVTASGRPQGWQDVFADRLNVWRKI